MLLQGCLGIVDKPRPAPKVTATLKLPADSGYLSKNDVLTFLIANSLTDTLNDWWKKQLPADTMGKYYKMDNGHYLACVLSANTEHSSMEVNKLIELDKNGLFVSAQDFFTEGCDVNRRTGALGKVGGFFVTYTCGHGATFHSSWFHLFGKLSDLNGSGQIMALYTLNTPPCRNIYSTWKMGGDTCIVTYTIQHSKATEDGCIPTESEKAVVRYYMADGKWRAADSTKLRLMDIAQ